MTTLQAPLTCGFMMLSQSVSRVEIISYRNVICRGMCAQKCAHARQSSIAGDTQERLAGKECRVLTTEYRQ
jgi:hypothetical protein